MLPRDLAVPDAPADGLLVEVGGRGVDVAVSGPDGVDDTALALIGVRNLEDAVAEDRHANAVIQGQSFIGSSICVVWFENGRADQLALVPIYYPDKYLGKKCAGSDQRLGEWSR